MSETVDLKEARKRKNRMTAKESLEQVENAINLAKRALKELYSRRKLLLRVLKEEQK